MTEEAQPAPTQETITPVTVGGDSNKIESIRSAARLLAHHRAEKRKQPEAAPQAAAAPQAEPEVPPQGETAAPQAEVRDETQASDQATELPSIEPPRSWTKEHKEAFASLPREIQERVSENERARETDFLRRQNEISELKKKTEAEKSAIEEQRKNAQATLPLLLQLVQAQADSEFANIKTDMDALQLANEDPGKYVRYQAHKQLQEKKLNAILWEMNAAKEREAKEFEANWQAFAEREDKLFAESAPDIADPEKGDKLRKAAIAALNQVGFDNDELAKLWNGEKISIRDHRLQRLIAEVARFETAREAAKTKTAAPLPPVQKPGAARGQPDTSAALKPLEAKLNTTGSLRDAARLRAAMNAQKRAQA